MSVTALLPEQLRSLTGAETSRNDTSGTRLRARPPPHPSAAPGAAPEVTEPPLFSGRKPGRPRGTRGGPGGAGRPRPRRPERSRTGPPWITSGD